jgi:3-methyladenine DNA glycosylase Tag
MWKVPVEQMCDRHLLGEHVEMHMFAGSIRKGISVQGYVDKGLLETTEVFARHEELVKEMIKRGMNHKSPLVYVLFVEAKGKINVEENIKELKRRCPECRRRIENAERLRKTSHP